jgi:hypothetical protein
MREYPGRMDLDGVDLFQGFDVDVVGVQQILDLLVLGQNHDLKFRVKMLIIYCQN